MKPINNVAQVSVFLLCAAGLLGSCASSSAPRSLSDSATVLEVPYVQQSEVYACGVAAVQSLCSYWNLPMDEATQERLVAQSTTGAGLQGEELCRELELLGFETFLFHGALDHGATGLFLHLDAGRPPLVMLSTKPKHGHYGLIVGYDVANKSVCLLDPVRGRQLVPFETFEKSWAATEHFTLLALPRPPVANPETKAE